MSEKPPSLELPAELAEAALLYESLGEQWVDDFARTAVVNRKSGFQLPTMLLFLFAYFSSRASSLKKLSNSLQRPVNRLLCDFAGFEKFPSQASVSRFLKTVSHERLEQLVTWILVTSHSSARALLRHPVCASLDTLGTVWQLFDLDPSVTGLRQRRLPDDSSLPPAIRDTDGLAAIGYAGRKRADVIIRRTLVQHVSSSLWIGSWIRQGGGGTRDTFQASVDAVLECCQFADFDPTRCILRVDAEGGGVPYITAYQRACVRYLVRSTHHSVLDQLNLDQLAREGRWFEVEADGPQRFALDLGDCLLAAGNATMTAQGTPYEPVVSRVVLCRRRASEGECTAGRVIDGYRYEIFATDLAPVEWPAAEVVKAYSHRSTIENRLALEDRDLGLDKVFTFELGGQAFATVVGLLVWNLRILCGFALGRDALDAESPPRQRSRKPQPVSLNTDVAPSCDDVTQSRQLEAPPDDESLARNQLEIERAIHHELDRSLVPRKLPPTMTWSEHGLICDNGSQLEVAGKRINANRNYVILKAPPGSCDDCARRLDCSRSTSPVFRKEISVAISDPTRFADLQKQYTELKLATRRDESHSPSPTTHQNTTVLTQHVYEAPDGGPLCIALGMLNPRELVHRFAEAVADTVLHVKPRAQPQAPRRRRYTYVDDETRSRRRHTWSQRLSYNRRAVGARINAFCGSSAANIMMLNNYDREAATLARERAEARLKTG